MPRPLATILSGAVFSFVLLLSGSAFAMGLDPAFSEPARGPQQAKGVVVWSHGRSINSEDSQSPTPIYLKSLRDDGWDVMRFDRLAKNDSLGESTKLLVEHVAELKQRGYKRVVLTGQSFGGFLSLMAADSSPQVDAVIATAPAAFGNFSDFYDSWRMNATRLYPLLQQVKKARVMVFYFHGDDFDPGGRGERSRAILGSKGIGYSVVDQPSYMTGHWASSTGLFLRRFGGCIRDFADDDRLTGEMQCRPSWGTHPSAELKLPPELADPRAFKQRVAENGAAGGSASPVETGRSIGPVRDTWYGFYPNGREVVFAVESTHGDNVGAVYAIGPSIDDKSPAAWTRRSGRVEDEGFVFQENGKSTLRFRMSPDGGLDVTWTSPDSKTSMAAHLRHIDPSSLAQPERTRADLAPIPAGTADGNSEKAED